MKFPTKAALLAPAILLAGTLATLAASPDENKATALAFYESLGSNAAEYLADGYVEHQQGSGYTFDGMLALIPENTTHIIHRTIAGDDLVFLHVEQIQPDGVFARGDLLRFDAAGKIVEHWAVVQAAVPASETKSGNSMFDGVAEVNLDSTLAAEFGAAHLAGTYLIFNNMDSDAVFAGVTEDYIQHNPGGPNGPGGLAGMLGYLQSQGIQLHKELRQTLSEGDFIVKLNFYSTTPRIPAFGQAIVFDIIRFANDGRAAEHWDIAQEITDIAELDSLF